MGDAGVDRGWAGRSHRSWIPVAAEPCGGGVAFVGAAQGLMHGDVGDGQGQSEEVEREGVRACAGGGNSAGASQASPVASEKIADLGLRASQIHDSVHKNNS